MSQRFILGYLSKCTAKTENHVTEQPKISNSYLVTTAPQRLPITLQNSPKFLIHTELLQHRKDCQSRYRTAQNFQFIPSYCKCTKKWQIGLQPKILGISSVTSPQYSNSYTNSFWDTYPIAPRRLQSQIWAKSALRVAK